MTDKKQVILIMTDSTRKDMLGCYNPKMQSPNLDRLAEQGLKFENAYSCQPVCAPARSAIFTGQFPHSNGVIANGYPLGQTIKTVGQRLTDQGVHCGYIGKYHLDGGDYFGYGVCPEGWDKRYWFDQKNYLDELSDEDKQKSRKYLTAFSEDVDENFTYAHKVINRALNFVNEYNTENFFLTVSLDEPHMPALCPPPYNTMYHNFRLEDYPSLADDLKDKPEFQRLWAGDNMNKAPEEVDAPSTRRDLFLGCNVYADYEIGRLLKKIEKEIPDALVIYTSDHGDMMNAHRLTGKNSSAYDEIANIPLIIKGGRVNETSSEMISHIDITPTILDYMGKKIPKLLEGKSLLPLINEAGISVNKEVYLEWTRYEVDHDGFGGLQMMRAVTNGSFKLEINLMDKDELYDLEKDPYEMKNLIDDGQYIQVRNELHDLILAHMDDTRDPYRGYQWAVRPWRTDKKPSFENGDYTRQREDEEYHSRELDYSTGLPMTAAVRKKVHTKDVKVEGKNGNYRSKN